MTRRDRKKESDNGIYDHHSQRQKERPWGAFERMGRLVMISLPSPAALAKKIVREAMDHHVLISLPSVLVIQGNQSL